MNRTSLILSVALFLMSIGTVLPARAADTFPEGTMRLLTLSHYQQLQLDAQAFPTSDGMSYLLVYNASKQPKHWIVSLPGSRGLATRELEVWYPQIKDRDIGLIVLQWWLGKGDGNDSYYTPRAMYREIDMLIRRLHLQGHPMLLHGFSRGSANLYAVKALDFVTQNNYFPLVVANSGGASLGYPPTGSVDSGVFGAKPFEGSKWVTSCGMQDPNPARDGCEAMRRTGEWIKAKGGEVALVIEDDAGGHGALNTNPANTRRLLDWFLAQ